MNKPDNVDEYIASFPKDVQELLSLFRATVKKEAPEAEETIKYAMPTYVLHRNLLHFAAFKNHIGFYPTPSGVEVFNEELSFYKKGKGSIQFPIDQPLPLDLITKIVKFCVKRNLEKAANKKSKKKV